MSFDQEVQLIPGATLPHPQLLEEYAFLHCAAEICSELQHPVLGRSLNALVKLHRTKHDEIEFYSQGLDLV